MLWTLVRRQMRQQHSVHVLVHIYGVGIHLWNLSVLDHAEITHDKLHLQPFVIAQLSFFLSHSKKNPKPNQKTKIIPPPKKNKSTSGGFSFHFLFYLFSWGIPMDSKPQCLWEIQIPAAPRDLVPSRSTTMRLGHKLLPASVPWISLTLQNFWNPTLAVVYWL